MKSVGVDTGGTFTDFVWIENGELKVFKVPSTPADPSKAVLEGLRAIGGEGRRVLHGTTVATNALLERKGARTAFITNRGFEDIIEIGRQNREELYNLKYRRPEPLVGRELRFGLSCRVDYKGEILQELSDEELRELVNSLRKARVESVAVCFLHSYANPVHEQIVGEVLGREGFYVSLSHEVLREFREYERSSTTVINAYVSPKMERYLRNIQSSLSERDRISVMQSNGGLISVEEASRYAVRTILSGPAGGVIGALNVAKLSGYERLITFDMGGTSTDVSLVDTKPLVSSSSKIEGLPVGITMIDIHTVGAGGGSLAYVDEGGALRVGPQSAGADPGPVCYGRGEGITTTDANLFLGRLRAEFFLGGSMKVYPDRVKEYMERFAADAGLSAMELAEGIIEVANTNMEKAIRKVSIERGYDPKEFVLVSFGGAGGLHAAELAKMVGVKRVLIPQNPGTLSALGMLMADVVKDYSYTVMLPQESASYEEMLKLFEGLEKRALEEMAAEGFPNPVIERELDLRYRGQSFEIRVPFTPDYRQAFEEHHRRLYGYSFEDREVEVVNLRLRAVGITDKPRIKGFQSKRETVVDEAFLGYERLIYHGEILKAGVYLRDKLVWGNRIEGPAVVVEYSSTTFLPPESLAYVDRVGNLVVEVCS